MGSNKKLAITCVTRNLPADNFQMDFNLLFRLFFLLLQFCGISTIFEMFEKQLQHILFKTFYDTLAEKVVVFEIIISKE